MDPKARQSYNCCRPCWGTAQVSKQACYQWDAFSVQQHFLIIRVDFSVGIREETLSRLGCRVAADSGTYIPDCFSWHLFRCHELKELFNVTSWVGGKKGHFSKVSHSSVPVCKTGLKIHTHSTWGTAEIHSLIRFWLFSRKTHPESH